MIDVIKSLDNICCSTTAPFVFGLRISKINTAAFCVEKISTVSWALWQVTQVTQAWNSWSRWSTNCRTVSPTLAFRWHLICHRSLSLVVRVPERAACWRTSLAGEKTCQHSAVDKHISPMNNYLQTYVSDACKKLIHTSLFAQEMCAFDGTQ